MKKSRKYIYQQDADRLAENLYHHHGSDIVDYESFDDAYNEYLKDQPKAKNNERLKHETFRKIRLSQNIPRKARDRINKGEMLRQKQIKFLDRTQNVKQTVIEKKKGKKAKIKKFVYEAKIKGRTVFARKIKTKRGYRFIDKLGRFAKRI